MKKIRVPSSKSITNRVLLLACLGETPILLKNVLDSEDAQYMQASLAHFGVVFEDLGNKQLRVIPPKGGLKISSGTELFIGNAGTAARFLSAFSLVVDGNFQLTGVERMKQRPQADLFKAILELGGSVKSLEKDGYLPAQFEGQLGEVERKVSISGDVSSQFLSGLMLVAPRLEKSLEITIKGEVPSWPYIQMTLDVLSIWGVDFEISSDNKIIKLFPGITNPKSFSIPSDMSSASYPVAWSLIKRVPICIENFGQKTFQGDEGFLEIVKKMGAQVRQDGAKCYIKPPQKLEAIGDFDWSAMPDISMTGMILASVANGTSVFRGLESLRVKECDRIKAMAQLHDLGIKFQVAGDIVTIEGNPDWEMKNNQDQIINPYDDHRIAMCFGILDSNLNIEDPHCVAKTWPQFWVELADWQEQLRPVSAIILKKDEKYLIVEKPRKENKWQFPQGGRDAGETDKQAAMRELQEECGPSLNIKFKGERPVGSYKYLFPKTFKRHEKQFIGANVTFFEADYLSGAVEVDGNEIISYKWVPQDQFEEDFDGSYLKVIQNFFTK